jgi:cyclophilin family peptidyl-prolyl cis-trans isomerase
VGTAKRERQKANKARAEQEVARQESKSKTTKIAVLVVGAIIAVFLIVVVAGQFVDDETDETLVSSDETVSQELETFDTEAEPVTTEAPAPDAAADADADAGEDPPESTLECPPTGGTDEQTQSFDGPPPYCLDPEVEYSALVTTTAGDITIALDQGAAPNTVNNFVFLARNNYFDGTVCHRVIQGFVAQCGDPTATGQGDPGYKFEDELPTGGSYKIGSIAMANSGPDTNGSQFFIISGDSGAALPPQYSLFGAVSSESDLSVVAKMDAIGSLDSSGVASEELRILSVDIIEG